MNSKNNISPRRRVELALHNEFVDKVPFTVFGTYWGGVSIENPTTPFLKYIPQSTTERYLRNRGLCLVDMTYWGYGIIRPNVRVKSTIYDENGRFMIRTDYDSELGNLYTVKEVSDFTVWYHSKMFKTHDDYKKILFLLNDTKVISDNDYGLKLLNTVGEDVILRGDFGFEPLQELITGDFFNTEQFSIQWVDNRDEMLRLYEAIVSIRRLAYKIVADSPLYYVCYGGNVTPAIISPENFKKYYVPHYEEAAEELHRKNKIIACHFDANMSLFKDIIADTPLDVIEAFTPYPDTDMTMKEAKKAWKNKALWINFPSSLHLASQEKIAQTTEQLIDEGGPDGLLIGITEDVPQNRWWPNFTTIIETIDKKFKIDPGSYI